MRYLLVLGLLGLTLTACSASAGPVSGTAHFKAQAIACASSAAFDKMVDAIAAKDDVGIQTAYAHGCTIPVVGTQVLVLGSYGMGGRHVRVQSGPMNGQELWTYMEDLEAA